MTGVEQQRRALRSTQTLRKPRNNVQFDWQWPLMRNSSPLVLARSISGWKSWYQPPLPNLSDVAAKDVEEIRTNARTVIARMAKPPGSFRVDRLAGRDEDVTAPNPCASRPLVTSPVIAVQRK